MRRSQKLYATLAKVVIAVNHIQFFSIYFPGLGLLEECHVNFGDSNNNLGFVSIEPELISLCIMAHDVQGSLHATGGASEEVGIVCDTYHGDSEGAKLKAKVGVSEGR